MLAVLLYGTFMHICNILRKAAKQFGGSLSVLRYIFYPLGVLKLLHRATVCEVTKHKVLLLVFF